MIEAQSRYITALIAPVLEARRRGKSLSLRPKKDRVDEYNAEIQKILANSSFADPNCNSWYKRKDTGLITNNWSGTVIEYQERLSKVRWDDYEVEGDGTEVLEGKEETSIGRVVEETRVSDAMLAVLGAAGMAVVAAGWLARNSKYLNRVRVR